MNLYWWYLCRMHMDVLLGPIPLNARYCDTATEGQALPCPNVLQCSTARSLIHKQCDRHQTYPGGKCTTTAKVSGVSGTGDMGIVSTHRVKEPHRCTCGVTCLALTHVRAMTILPQMQQGVLRACTTSCCHRHECLCTCRQPPWQCVSTARDSYSLEQMSVAKELTHRLATKSPHKLRWHEVSAHGDRLAAPRPPDPTR
jgi:hypothetical protein